MKITKIHPIITDSALFKNTQTALFHQVSLKNVALDESIKLCAGVDLAYWSEAGLEWGVCSIIVIDYSTKEIIEKTHSFGKVIVPYVPGYLAFRELPLIIEAAEKLRHTPDIFIFDGNGYLHPQHMGIATHASFFLNKPTIGVAKSYFKIDNTDYKMPDNKADSYENIIVNNEIYGRVIRTHQNVKPIFISCGSHIDLQTTTEIVLHLINAESRLPIPVRLADLETRRLRKLMKMGAY